MADLRPRDRVALIRECVALLDPMEWEDIDLILDQHGLPTTDSWSESRKAYGIAMIRNASSDTLRELHSFLTSENDNSAPGKTPFKTAGVRLFMSHLASNRQFAGEVERFLQNYGIEGFVAHDSIEPSQEWQQVIEAGLASCDAMAVFLHDGFIESRWCDQEVGWVLGRQRPTLPLKFTSDPHGFLGKLQAHNCVGLNANRVAEAIAQWIVGQQTLSTPLAESLTTGFQQSGFYDNTRRLAGYLEGMQNLTDDQLQRLETAAQQNSQVRDCNIAGKPGPEWVARLVKSRREPAASDPWGDEPPF